MQASYLYSRLVGNYDGFVNQRSPLAAPATTADFDSIPSVANSFGRLSLDRTHQLQLAGTCTLPFGLSAGVVAAARSGAPRSVVRASPDGGVSLAPRGSFGELPWTYRVDLHLEHRFALGPLSLTAVADVFNVTNVQQVTAVDDVYAVRRTDDVSPPFTHPTNPGFGRPTAFQSPRFVRVGARLSF